MRNGTSLPSVSRVGAKSSLPAIACMIGSTLLAATMNAGIRHVSSELHPFEIVFFRNLFAIIVILPWIIRGGLATFRTRRFGMHLARALVNVVNMTMFVTALAIAPLANVIAIGFSAPLFATMMAVIVFGEYVGVRRWTALLVGLSGTLLVLRPGGGLDLGEMLALLSAITWAMCLLIIRSLGKTERSTTTVAYMIVLMSPLSLVLATWVWQWPNATQLAWLTAIGVLGGGSQMLLAQALRMGEIGAVTPFEFLKLVWITIIAYLAFDELPHVWTWIGGTVIFAGSIYIVLRERQMARGGPIAPLS